MSEHDPLGHERCYCAGCGREFERRLVQGSRIYCETVGGYVAVVEKRP